MAGCASALLVVACVAVRVLAGDVALPGDPKFRVTLLNIQPTEGSISPSFSPDATEFDVTVTQESATTLSVVLMLDLTKYNPRHCPVILVDGQVLEYSPLTQVRALIPLGSDLGPIKKTVKIKVMDPAEQGGNWLNFLHKERSHEYVLHVGKPPQYNKLTTPTGIVVKDGTGRVMSSSPAFDPEDHQQTKFEYTLATNWRNASVQVFCPAVAGVSQQYDGAPAAVASVRGVDFDSSYTARIHASCSYTNPEFNDQPFVQTYVLEFSRHVDPREAKMISAELMALPQSGYCSSVSTDDPDLRSDSKAPKQFGELAAATGFVCRVDKSQGELVATFSSTSGSQPQTQLIDRHSGQRIEMANAIPTGVYMTHDRRHFKLKVEAGDISLTYPVVVIWPARCDTLACPDGQATVALDPFAARVHMCAEETCSEQDQQHCCAPRAMCSTYTAGCLANKILRPDAASVACRGVACSLEADQSLCCQT
jgi:hypothetical protein